MKKLLLLAVMLIPCAVLHGQAWSGILDPSRAIDWRTGVGFSIPSYPTPCATQPTLTPSSSGAASANAAQIKTSILSCDSTHNAVNIPTGTYYVAGIDFGGKSNVVVRGASPNSSYLFMTHPGFPCFGYTTAGAFCMGGNALYAQSGNIQPGASNACAWTAGYAQGTTSITLNSCGTAPTPGTLIILDQADDGADTGGVFLCSTFNTVVNCTQKGNSSGANADGRVIPATTGVQHSEQQVVRVVSASGSGTGPYAVTISNGVYFNNIRSGQSPGAFLPSSIATNEGVENLTIDHSQDTTSQIGGLMIWCADCWFQNNRSIAGTSGILSNHIAVITDWQPVVQNNYFYGSQHTGSSSYCVQMLEVSAGVVQNNIMQNTTSPDIKDAVTGNVVAYNFTPFINFGRYLQGLYASHNSGSAFNLLEGNATTEFFGDDVWGTSDLMTVFRNHAIGWQPGYSQQTFAFSINAGVRAVNIIGNVLGQPGYHTQYEAYATSTTAGVHRILNGGSTSAGPGTINQSIYELGWTDTGGLGVCSTPPVCDPLTWSTMMRWGNYDTVDLAVEWNTTEASPGAVPYVGANPAPSSHVLPASLYLTSRPSWFRSVPFPAYGPDVASGTTGICTSGTYNGLWVTSSGQCGGGGFSAHAWGGHANANPAQDCYLNVMSGPPDGSGGALAFDPKVCYAGTPPPSVTGTGVFPVPVL